MKEYKFKINGKDYSVTVNGVEGKNADVTVNGINYQVELENGLSSAPAAPTAPVTAAAPHNAPDVSMASPALNRASEGKTVTSPLPGVIIDVCVKEGDSVKRGQKIAVLEAMKMENEIQSPMDGTVKAIHVSKGLSVLEGADIATIS